MLTHLAKLLAIMNNTHVTRRLAADKTVEPYVRHIDRYLV